MIIRIFFSVFLLIFITFHGCSDEHVGENNDPTSLTEEDTEDYDYIGYGFTGYEACKNVLVTEFADKGYGGVKKEPCRLE